MSQINLFSNQNSIREIEEGFVIDQIERDFLNYQPVGKN